MASVAVPAARRRPFQAKHVMWVLFGLATLFVLLTRDRTLLDPNSFLRQRYAPIPWLMFLHGIPGALALVVGVFQFSSRLRQKYLQVHRRMGKVYVVSVLIAAPVACIVAVKLPIPGLTMGSFVQAFGWVSCTLMAWYCARTGKIQQHREWMMRGYPFAAIFVLNRVIIAIPPIAAMGMEGITETVWTMIALAAFLPSFFIEWQKLAASKPTARARAAAGD